MASSAQTFTNKDIALTVIRLVLRQSGGSYITADMRLGRDLELGVIKRGLLLDEVNDHFDVRLVPVTAHITVGQLVEMVKAALGARLVEAAG
jgi:hypothetical protein